MPDRKPKFQVGDLVRHRASKEVALVVESQEGCTTRHKPYQFFCGPDCKRGFCGRYILTRTFGDEFVADEGCLELVTRFPAPNRAITKPEPPPNRDTTEGKVPVEAKVPSPRLADGPLYAPPNSAPPPAPPPPDSR